MLQGINYGDPDECRQQVERAFADIQRADRITSHIWLASNVLCLCVGALAAVALFWGM